MRKITLSTTTNTTGTSLTIGITTLTTGTATPGTGPITTDLLSTTGTLPITVIIAGIARGMIHSGRTTVGRVLLAFILEADGTMAGAVTTIIGTGLTTDGILTSEDSDITAEAIGTITDIQERS